MTKTVLVTGASGFLAKHIVLGLLDRGYRVIGSVRSVKRQDEIRDAVKPHLADPKAIDRLSFVTLDLTRNDGWDKAMQGIDALIHTASPFPLASPKDETQLIRPAVEGVRNALTAAQKAGVHRVILTSSVAAVHGQPKGNGTFAEDSWTDLDAPGLTPYSKSKTLAEQAAWRLVQDHPDMKLTTINPTLILGPPLDRHYGSSVDIVARLLAGKDPMLPNMGLCAVDVRDVADAHIAAMETDASIGERVIVTDDFLWFRDFARILKGAYPAKRIPTRVAPTLLIRLIALWDRSIAGIVPALGQRVAFTSDKSRKLLKLPKYSAEQALLATAEALEDLPR